MDGTSKSFRFKSASSVWVALMAVVLATTSGCATSNWPGLSMFKLGKEPSPFATSENSETAQVSYESRSDGNNVSIAEGVSTASYQVPVDSSQESNRWLTSMEEAKSISRQTGKPILANFTGTDWCKFCIKLEDEVFSTQRFKNWSSDRYVLLTVDFPKRTQLPGPIRIQNTQLKHRYQITGFPTVLILDSDGEVQGKSGYVRGGPDAWISAVENTLR